MAHNINDLNLPALDIYRSFVPAVVRTFSADLHVASSLSHKLSPVHRWLSSSRRYILPSGGVGSRNSLRVSPEFPPAPECELSASVLVSQHRVGQSVPRLWRSIERAQRGWRWVWCGGCCYCLTLRGCRPPGMKYKCKY